MSIANTVDKGLSDLMPAKYEHGHHLRTKLVIPAIMYLINIYKTVLYHMALEICNSILSLL